ncbi:bifunctional diguanylate cyclase/phosphodiesterase [Novosphingobium rosa]|uniref:bifunctional diguanylate cyclase/phosphodiesterase n=1 Tax=Novosphingobium rosa TaxID=76978 RepID=UPI000832582E|nr:bifunctional diguanylate cyclase/phosphodiesterase [Novosphingobium rosa]
MDDAQLDLEDEPMRDALTGLPDLDMAREKLADWAQNAGQAPDEPNPATRVHALLLGLRRFETVNLAYGSATGDGALVEVAGRLTRFAEQELTGRWMAARAPGGTFLLIADEPCSRERWQMFAEQLADRVARPLVRRGGTLRLSPRVALLRVLQGESSESVLDRLAQTFAVAQRHQGLRVMWADGEATRAGRTAAELEADLLKAIDRHEIEVLFQPQFALNWHAGPEGEQADERLSGAEALARWNHPKLGRIGAGALFAIAERADHVVPLSRHIAEQALKAAAAWPAPLRLSLNVTAADLSAGSFPFDLGRALGKTGFPNDRLTLEVTEQVLVSDMSLAERSLSDLAAQDIRIALDDFGAGFCNFRYLKTLPLHYLKLDRSMVDGITEDPRDLAVLRAIAAMAHALDLEVIAEGIESEPQRLAVAREGCAYYQGFVRAQPMSAEAFLQLASEQ